MAGQPFGAGLALGSLESSSFLARLLAACNILASSLLWSLQRFFVAVASLQDVAAAREDVSVGLGSAQQQSVHRTAHHALSSNV